MVSSPQPIPVPVSPQQQLDLQKWAEELRRRDAERAHDREAEFFTAQNKATIDTGQLALRTSILVNGGAAIAMLAFIGHLVGEDKIKSEQIRDITSSLIWFAIGVACALVALGCTYFSSYSIAKLSHSRTRSWTHPFVSEDSPSSANGVASRLFFPCWPS